MTIHLIGTMATTYVTGACGAFEPENITGDTSVVNCKRCRNTHSFSLLASSNVQNLKHNPVIEKMLAYRRGPNNALVTPSFEFGEDETGGPAFFWINPWSGQREKIANLWWPAHPPEATEAVEQLFSELRLYRLHQRPGDLAQSDVMRAAEKAAETVASWSPSKQAYAARVTGTSSVAQAPIERGDLVDILREILDAEKDFLETLPEDWEGDPLHDACLRLRLYLSSRPVSPVSSTDSDTHPPKFMMMQKPDCPRCKGMGRVGMIACNDCGATGQAPPSTPCATDLPDDLCPGGVNPGWDECPKCGATMNDACAFSSADENTARSELTDKEPGKLTDASGGRGKSQQVGTPAVSPTTRSTPERPMVVGRVTGKPREGDQCPGMPHAICHACGLGYRCFDPDCPNDKQDPTGMGPEVTSTQEVLSTDKNTPHDNQAARAPKVRTSHHRDKEEAARLQALVDERYAASSMPSTHSQTQEK